MEAWQLYQICTFPEQLNSQRYPSQVAQVPPRHCQLRVDTECGARVVLGAWACNEICFALSHVQSCPGDKTGMASRFAAAIMLTGRRVSISM